MNTSGASGSQPTGGELALLSGLVESLRQTRTAMGALQAFETQMLAAAVALAEEQAARGPAGTVAADMPLRAIAAEIATALHVSDRSLQRQLSDAHTATHRFPAALAALADGRISRAHLSVIVDAGLGIDDEVARADYEAQAVGRAETETPGRLRPIARMLAERALSRSIDERHAAARSKRRVVVTDLDDGMAELLAILPATLAHGIHDRLSSMARAVRAADEPVGVSAQTTLGPDAAAQAPAGAQAGAEAPGPAVAVAVTDDRSIDEVRADLLCDLVLSGQPVGHGDGLEFIAATVQVTVPVLALLGADGDPATLAGHGPIDADTARRLTAAAPGWDRVLTHPVSGAVLAVDRYRPSEELRRHLRVRDEHCRFPGCSVSTTHADLDHTIDAALGGPTAEANLAHLCRRHHVLKHASAWTVEQIGGGVLEWVSPTGRRYVDSPGPTLRFAPTDPPPF